MNKNEKIKLLADLVAIRSMNDNEEAVAEYLAAFLDKYGIESEIVQSRPRPAVAPAQQQQFTFAPTTMPANFVANPNNHGRWSIDESGKRHYLNGARSKRPREGCS